MSFADNSGLAIFRQVFLKPDRNGSVLFCVSSIREAYPPLNTIHNLESGLRRPAGRSRAARHAAILLAVAVAVAAAAAPARRTCVVASRDFVKPLTFTGELETSQSITVYAPASRIWGMTISFIVPDGASVRRGDVLVRFDTSSLELDRLDLEKKREEARVQVAQKEADLESRRQDLLLEQAAAVKNVKVAELYARLDPDLLPRSDYETYQYNLEKARLSLAKVEERLGNLARTAAAELAVVRLQYDQADIELRQIQAEIDAMTIAAPADGLVQVADNWESSRKYQVGDKIFEGSAVLQLPDLDTLQVDARVYDTDLLQLAGDLPAEIVLDAIPDRTFRGRVVQLSDAASSRNRRSQLQSFRMKVALERPDPAVMKPGMTARVRVPVTRAGALVVPRAAVHTDSRGNAYLLRPGNPPRRVPVEVLDANATEAVVQGDVRAGEEVLPAAGGAGASADAAIEWLSVKRDDFAFTVAGSGQVIAEKAVDIGPPALPRVRRFKIIRLAEEGIQVRPGDFLVQFDPSEIFRYLRDETAELDKARQEILRTGSTRESAVKDLELELEEAKTQEVRAQSKLLDVREFESSIKVREAEYELELAKARTAMLNKKLAAVQENARLELGLLRDKQRFHQERVQSYQAALAALEVTAPIGGVVIHKTDWNNEKKQVGSDVFMMDTIISLPDLTTLVVRGQVAEVDSNKIRVGLPVAVSFDGIPEKVFRGRITQIADSLTAGPQDRPIKSLGFTVKLETVDPQRMRPGMAARLEVEIDHFQNVLAVPLAALETAGGRSFLWVERDGRPQRREVTVGRNNGLMAIVTNGLAEGERVASRPVETASAANGNGRVNGRASQ